MIESASNATKEAIDLPEHKKDEVLHSIDVLLMTINENETSATQHYLHKLDGHAHVYKFLKQITLGEQTPKHITFYIGKYGICPVAIGVVPNDFEMHTSDNSLTVMAYDCFPNLSTIINIGITHGIQKKVKICDVLVSSKVVYIDKGKADHEKTQRKTIDVSNELIKIFNQPDGWPEKSIQERLEYNKIMVPNVISGVILTGLHLINGPAMKSEKIGPHVIGIEMEESHLFRGALQNMANIIIIKAVCDFEAGKYSETYQPTAALVAANLVYECLSSSEAQKLFTGLFIIIMTDLRAS